MDSYWTKIKQDSQYQQEEVQDGVAYLNHFQAILKEFNPTYAPNKTTFIHYLRDGLYPSIWALFNYQRQDLDMWDEVVEKAGDAKAKINL